MTLAEEDRFTPADDDLHPSSGDFYETETFWYSFFVPERKIGGWLYASVRSTLGATGGGMWMWDATGTDPWELPFFEQFGHLKPPVVRGPGCIDFPTGLSITTREHGMSYDLRHEDRHRVQVQFRFDALEEPVPLRRGAPPYPKASHYDQTGRLTGHIILDGEHIDVDCHAMRDRSWGPRHERGYRRVGYTWAASPEISLLTYTAPDGTDLEHVYTGYVRRDGQVARIVDGRREVLRDPAENWVTGISLEVRDELGRVTTGRAEGLSRMFLPGATSLCLNTSLRWTIEGRTVNGEDQDVWPIREWARTSSAS
ncbi:hypothetical protein SAMN04489712_12229 [Thermomonospora echinospora]|uniref:DUF7065 domain-containing protein n=1 Tax=Thermomonospora echinospora TaxID=1992 RepID=A0A1H6DTE2_9ACTN|nr:hypothetical protein [Thermomonospora echinospora]SEG88551.1 hypothetical protein SAMN04489712_12229 [Thermomonospora echinospora]